MRDSAVVLYAAVTLGGCLAKADGGVGFLSEFEGGEGNSTYKDFFAGAGSLVMGRKSFDQALEFGWVYEDKPTAVLTHRPLPEETPEGVFAASGADLEAVLERLWTSAEGRVWLFGGGDVARQFMAAGLLDELDLFVTPHILGGGIPLWGSGSGRHWVALTSSEHLGQGMVRLRYEIVR